MSRSARSPGDPRATAPTRARARARARAIATRADRRSTPTRGAPRRPEPERHHEERDAEPCLLGKRLEIAVREIGDRKLERVRRAQDECGDADVDHEKRRDHAKRRGSDARGVRAPGRRRITSRTTSGPISSASAAKSPQRARSSRQVVPGGADGLGRRGRGNTDAEGEHPCRRVPVVSDHPPAHGVPVAPAEPRDRCDHDDPPSSVAARSRETTPSGPSTWTAFAARSSPAR